MSSVPPDWRAEADAYALSWLGAHHLDGAPRAPEDPADREARIAAAACEATARLFEQEWRAHLDRVEAHRRRLAAVATWLGTEVVAHRVTVADAERRLDALATLGPPGWQHVPYLPRPEARAVIRNAYGRGVRGRAA